jgi:hypothetical protein
MCHRSPGDAPMADSSQGVLAVEPPAGSELSPALPLPTVVQVSPVASAITLVRQKIPAEVPTDGRAPFASKDLFELRRGRPRIVEASPCLPR